MKINYLSVIIALGAVVTLFSCSSENAISPELTFTIGIPKGEAVVYDAVQDAAETKINSLYLYEFDSDKKLVAAPIDIKSVSTINDGFYTYTRDLKTPDKSIRYFYIVANEEPSSLMTVGRTIDELKTISLSETLGTNQSCASLLSGDAFPMTGIATKNGSTMIPLTNDGIKIEVALTRIVARLDIKNNMEGLIITDIKLNQANNKSHLLLDQDVNAIYTPDKSQKVDNVLPFDVSSDLSMGKGDEIKKAFYLYEGNQGSRDGAVRVAVTGTLGGEAVFYSIPFWNGTKEDGTEIVVQRNHLYHLILGEGSEKIPDTDTNASFMLTDKPWTEQNVVHGFEILDATYTAVSGTSYDSQKHILTIESKAYTDLSFDFTTKFEGHSSYTASVIGSPVPSWIRTDVSGDCIKVSVDANDAADAVEREAIFEVTSNASPNTYYTIVVKQGKATPVN